MQSQREGYLDGMKGLACLFILLGHFTGIYKYAENASQIDSWFVRILTEGPVSFFTAESFWLYLFFVISGYLLIMSTPPPKNKGLFGEVYQANPSPCDTYLGNGDIYLCNPKHHRFL